MKSKLIEFLFPVLIVTVCICILFTTCDTNRRQVELRTTDLDGAILIEKYRTGTSSSRFHLLVAKDGDTCWVLDNWSDLAARIYYLKEVGDTIHYVPEQLY